MPARVMRQNMEIKELFRAKIKAQIEREKQECEPAFLSWRLKRLTRCVPLVKRATIPVKEPSASVTRGGAVVAAWRGPRLLARACGRRGEAYH